MSKLISVIIPTYNRAGIITDAINTVLNQTYKHLEIIIIDDGSTDNSREIIENIKDSRIRYIYQENSGRPSSARNKGIKIAKGEYIAFLDSDDLWHPQKLEKQINILDENSNVGLVTNWCVYKTFKDEEIQIKKYQAKSQEDNSIFILTKPDKVFTATPTLLIRKECFEKVGLFDEEMTYCEDWDMFFRISLFYEIYNIEEVLTYVRVHGESLSQNNDVTKFSQGYLRFLEKAFENKDLPPELFTMKDEAYSNALWCIGSWALQKSKDGLIAKESLLKSLKYSPKKLLNLKFLVLLFLSFSPSLFLVFFETLKKSYRKLLGVKG